MNEWQKQRVAQNEASFRDINERLEDGLRKVTQGPELQEFVCECGKRACEATVPLTFDEYERVRRDSRHFAVVPGHVFPETEHVVESHDRFEIVEKEGSSVDLVDAADPRSPGDAGLRED